MKALIRVTRRTEYASIVEMPQAKYDKLKAALDDDDQVVVRNAEKNLNRLIDVEDWQDDELMDIDEFVALKD